MVSDCTVFGSRSQTCGPARRLNSNNFPIFGASGLDLSSLQLKDVFKYEIISYSATRYIHMNNSWMTRAWNWVRTDRVWGLNKPNKLGFGQKCVSCIYISHLLHLHCTPCSTAVQFCIGEAWLCMCAATFASRVTTLSRRAAGALLFDGQLVCRARSSREEQSRASHEARLCCAMSASPEEAKFKTWWSGLFRADHFLFLDGKTGRSPGCAAVNRNKINQPGYGTTSVDCKTMSSVRLTTLRKNLQQMLEFGMYFSKKTNSEAFVWTLHLVLKSCDLKKTLFSPSLSIFHLLPHWSHPSLPTPPLVNSFTPQLLHLTSPAERAASSRWKVATPVHKDPRLHISCRRGKLQLGPWAGISGGGDHNSDFWKTRARASRLHKNTRLGEI